MLHFFFFSVCKKSEHMTLKCLGYLFKHKKQLFHQKLKKNNKFFLKCHSHLQLFRIGNKGIFYHTWCESSKPLLSDQIVLMIERPKLWQKSRKTMNMHRTKNWQTVREQQKSVTNHRTTDQSNVMSLIEKSRDCCNFKFVNLQYNTLGRFFVCTNKPATKRLMLQDLIYFHNFLQNSLQKLFQFIYFISL